MRSPIGLTDEGEEVASEINAREIFDKNFKKLVDKVYEENPQTAYDIQTVSFRLASDALHAMLTLEEMNRLKQSAFNRGFPLPHIWIIFGIYLRDRILSDKGIAPSDLDK